MPLSYRVPLSPTVRVFPIYAFPWGNMPLLCWRGIQSVALCHAHRWPIPEIFAVEALETISDRIIFRELLSTYWSCVLFMFEFFSSAGSDPSSVIVPSTSSRFWSIYFLKTFRYCLLIQLFLSVYFYLLHYKVQHPCQIFYPKLLGLYLTG